MKKYSIILIDDELPARRLLENYISKIPNLTLLGSYSNALDALAALQNQPVDIILTDIQMPDMSGIDFVNTVKNQAAIIFTTAYSQYALDGFDLGVVDYLLKPFELTRFTQAILKAVDFVDTKFNNKNKTQEMSTISTFTWIKADRQLYRVEFKDIVYIEGQHEYVTFHLVDKDITAYYTLKYLEANLPPGMFVRIHKSYIVSIYHIQSFDSNSVMIAGKKLPLSGIWRSNLEQLRI